MTPTQRKKHVAALEEACVAAGLKKDNWGNWLVPGHRSFRIKFKDVNVRSDRKYGDAWHGTGFSKVISQLTLEEFQRYLGAIKHSFEQKEAMSDSQAAIEPKKTAKDLFRELRHTESKGISLLRIILEKHLGQYEPRIKEVHHMQSQVQTLLAQYDETVKQLKEKGVELEKF